MMTTTTTMMMMMKILLLLLLIIIIIMIMIMIIMMMMMILIWRLAAGLSLETVKYRQFPTVTYGRKLCSRAVEVSKTTGSGYRFALALAADYCLHCVFRHFHQFLHAAFPRYSFQCEFRNTRMSLCGKMYTRLSISHTRKLQRVQAN